jgi:hypothetical protein
MLPRRKHRPTRRLRRCTSRHKHPGPPRQQDSGWLASPASTATPAAPRTGIPSLWPPPSAP